MPTLIEERRRAGLVGAKDAAKIIGVSRQQFYRLARKEIIKPMGKRSPGSSYSLYYVSDVYKLRERLLHGFDAE